MKLRNKKTGKLVDINLSTNMLDEDYITEYGSLEEFNEDWEDAPEEPKYIYYIDWKGNIQCSSIDNDWNSEKSIGNYFETKEEAEQAVKKLKAWKLLKDECNIKFCGIIRDENAMLKGVKLVYDRHPVTIDRMRECTDSLYLLFGDEQ